MFGIFPASAHRLTVAILAMTAVCCISQAQGQQPGDYSLVPVDHWELQAAFPLDWDGDGTDEILHLNNFGNATVYVQGGNCCWSYTFGPTHDDSWIYLRQFYYRAAERIFMLSHRRGDSIVMYIRNGGHQHNLLLDVRPKVVGRPMPGGSGYFIYPSLISPKTGPRAIIGYWITEFTLSHPRGLAAYDFMTGRELWHYWLGGNISDEICYYDVDGDGRDEILICTGAAANGGQANGTDDGHTYVMCFDLDGRLLWKREIGGYFSDLRMRLVDGDRDGRKEILCWEKSHRDRQNMGRPDAIRLLRPSDGGLIKKVESADYLLDGALGDIDNDEREELVVGGADGLIRVFSEDLELKGEFQNPSGNPVSVADLNDLNGDGYKEVVAVDRNGDMSIVSHKLETVLTSPLNTSPERVRTVRAGKTRRMLAAGEVNGKNKWILWKFKPRPLYARSHSISYLAAAFLAVAITALALLFLMWSRSAKLEKAMEQLDRPGLVLLSRKGKIVALNHWASVLLGIDAASSRGRAFLEVVPEGARADWRSILEQKDLHNTFHLKVGEAEQQRKLAIRQVFGANRRALLIDDITERENIQRAREWATVAQQMAHGIKTPLTTILLAVQKIDREAGKTGDGKAIEELCHTIEQEVLRLRKSSDGLMRFLNLSPPNREKVDIGSFVENIAGKYGLSRENGLELVVDIAPNLPPVLLDPKLMEIALDNLIENAVAAVGDKGRVEIDVLLTDKIFSDFKAGSAIKIEITDNGPGIALAYKSKLFVPFFTTKNNGTGLGLMLTKRIIEDHGGQIEIESREKIGTEVIIYLPL